MASITLYRPRTLRDPTLASGFDATPPEGTSERGTAGHVSAREWCGMARPIHERPLSIPRTARQGEGFLQARGLSPIPALIISACRSFGTRTVLVEAVGVPLALGALFIAGGML